MGEVIVVTSGKDGAGKTVVVANLGVALAGAGHSVVLMDLNIGFRNLDILLGMESRVVYDLADVISGVCRIRQAMIRDERFSNLYLISAPQSHEKAIITEDHLIALCGRLKELFDYIIIDAPAGTGKGLNLAASPADRAVVVTIPEYAAIRDAELTNAFLESKGITGRSLVINKILPELFKKGLVPEPEEISQSLRLPIIGLIPYDNNIHISANMGVPIAVTENNYISKNLKGIGERLASKS
jgi:septum site-determining protein MinD